MNTLEDPIFQEYKKSLPRQRIISRSDKIKLQIFFFVLGFLKLLFPQGKVQRFEKSVKFYLGLIDIDSNEFNSEQKPTEFLYLGLTAKPWYESGDYEILQIVADTLAQGAKEIENEWLSNRQKQQDLVSRYKGSDLHPSLKQDEWGEFMLRKKGKFTDSARLLFSKTVSIVSTLEPFLLPFGQVVFLVLKPGAALPQHYDASNIDITCQLGVIIPDNCAISVAGETRNWIEGKSLFFDHSFKHKAWNDSEKDRVVLLLDLYHPELTKVEKFLLLIFGKVFVGY